MEDFLVESVTFSTLSNLHGLFATLSLKIRPMVKASNLVTCDVSSVCFASLVGAISFLLFYYGAGRFYYLFDSLSFSPFMLWYKTTICHEVYPNCSKAVQCHLENTPKYSSTTVVYACFFRRRKHVTVLFLTNFIFLYFDSGRFNSKTLYTAGDVSPISRKEY